MCGAVVLMLMCICITVLKALGCTYYISLLFSVSVFRPWMWTAVSFTRWRSQLRPFTPPVWVSDLSLFTASPLCHSSSSHPVSWCDCSLIGLQSGNLWHTSAHPSDMRNVLGFIYRWHFWYMICWYMSLSFRLELRVGSLFDFPF